MVDQEEFHHAFAGLLDHRRVGEDFGWLAVRPRPHILDAHSARGLRLWRPAFDLDQAHAAIAGDRQPLMVAEARNFCARGLGRLHQRKIVGDVDELAVNLDIGHLLPAPLAHPELDVLQVRPVIGEIGIAVRFEMLEPRLGLIERGDLPSSTGHITK